ncbi:MAG: hypothetical protein Fur0046_35160 [Cyanobacteria bacterium J069]|nr:MAG: hypothetical protein D6742_16975 [Cyanobacteria bacterium J069]
MAIASISTGIAACLSTQPRAIAQTSRPYAIDDLITLYAAFDLCARILENHGNDLSHDNTPNSARMW